MKTTLTQIYAMAWKEWREARWYAWAGFILLLVVPAISTGLNYLRWAAAGPRMNHWTTYPQFAWIIFALGAAFAAITAIGIASRDLREGMIAPWRQTPIRPWLFMAVKFLTGLGIMLGLIVTASLLHLIMAKYVGMNVAMIGPNADNYAIRDVLRLFSSYIFVLLAVYAICFALAALLRPVLSAVLVCAIAIGLLHFLPVFWPVLSFLNTFELWTKPVVWIFESREKVVYFSASMGPVHWLGYGFVFPKMLLLFVLSMIVLAGLATLGAMVIAVRGWRVELNVMRVGWTLGVVFMGLFSIAAMQVGNNLEPVTVLPVTLDNTRRIEELHVRGDEVLLRLVKTKPNRLWKSNAPMQLLRANLSQSSTLLLSDHPSSLQRDAIPHNNNRALAWSPDRPQIVFYVDQHIKQLNDEKSILTRLDLVAMELTPEGTARELTRVDLFTWFKESKNQQVGRFQLHLQQDRLFIRGIMSGRYYLLIFDVSDPAKLQCKRPMTDATVWGYVDSGGGRRSQLTINLPKLSGYSAQERFDLFWGLEERWKPFLTEGDTIAEWDRDFGLQVYRCVKKGETNWMYDRVGQRQQSALEKVFTSSVIDAVLQDGLLYLLMQDQHSGLMVFDLRDPAEPRKIGHYYAPGERLRCLAATGDGRVIAAGYALHVFDLRDRARSVR